MSGIFISYRRDDAGAMARRLYDALCARFGPASVFIDVETIEVGADFADVIDAKVGFCDGLIAVIGATWSAAVDAAGRRRLDDPADWVRLEIAAALRRGIKVVPVLVDGAPMPSPRELPEPLAPLARHQAFNLRSARFEEDAARLGAALERLGAGRNAVSWLSLITRRHLALDPLDLHTREVLGRALRFLLYMVVAGSLIRLPAAAREGQQFWQFGYVVSSTTSHYVEWLAAAVLLHLAMRLVGGRATIQASVAATCFLSAFLPVIGLSQIPVWGLNISVMQATPDLSWTPARTLEQLETFTAGLGTFGTVRVVVSFVAATILWGVMPTAMVQALRTLHRLGWLRVLPAFAGGWLAYLAFVVFFYAPLIGMVYQAFGLPRPR
jgi:TIR domain